MTGSDVSHVSGSMFYACATGSCAISALVRPFSQEVTKSRDRKRSCPALLFFPRTFFPRIIPPYFFPVFFFRTFFLVVVVHHVGLGCSLRRPRPMTIGNYHPFYFHILGVLYDVRVLSPFTGYLPFPRHFIFILRVL